MISGRKFVHLRESLPQQGQGEGRESEGKVELWLWELEQWVRREGPTITASCGSLQKCLHHDSVRGGCVLGLNEKTHMSHDVTQCTSIHQSSTLMLMVDGEGIEWPDADVGRGASSLSQLWRTARKCPNGVVSF